MLADGDGGEPMRIGVIGGYLSSLLVHAKRPTPIGNFVKGIHGYPQLLCSDRLVTRR